MHAVFCIYVALARRNGNLLIVEDSHKSNQTKKINTLNQLNDCTVKYDIIYVLSNIQSPTQ